MNIYSEEVQGMYSIVLATMLTTGAASPSWGCHGCHGCCGGCYGCCGGCWGCCGGCWGCCGGCWGCWGGCYGCYGCYGCCGGCYGCYGCYGGMVALAPAAVFAPGTVIAPGTVVPSQPAIQVPPQKDEKKSSYLGNAAAVIVKAPAGVQLSVEDRPLPRTATEETFRTPELQAGYSYTYTFKAQTVREGKTVAYTKKVKVRSGQTAMADFTKLLSEGKDAATVTVKLPADARLYVDGVFCPLTSTTRSFNTPELDAGQKYYYTLKSEVIRDGVVRETSKRVVVEAGREVAVEFTDVPMQTVSR
ncbi:MAG: TIGR03000 domain-containing protein [Gemmataceae bacterium]